MERVNMQPIDLRSWQKISTTVFVPHTESDYERLVRMLDELVDQVGEDESHPLASLMDVLSALIENYENAHVPELVAD
jgi:HTH-type transcriptional regulator/antitoxin HigA